MMLHILTTKSTNLLINKTPPPLITIFRKQYMNIYKHSKTKQSPCISTLTSVLSHINGQVLTVHMQYTLGNDPSASSFNKMLLRRVKVPNQSKQICCRLVSQVLLHMSGRYFWHSLQTELFLHLRRSIQLLKWKCMANRNLLVWD